MKSPYKHLAFETAVHFVIMFAVMYTMVDSFADVYLNINNVYMTGMMVLPMIALMILSMRHMYTNKKLNGALVVGSIALFLALYAFERQQTFVGDKQFLRSMIPHHSGAILMCEKSSITDPEIKRLCESIIEAQVKEINQMKDILARLKGEAPPPEQQANPQAGI